MKNVIKLALCILLAFAMVIPAFATDSQEESSITDIEYGRVYQGNNAHDTAGAAQGPDLWGLYCDNPTSIKIIIDQNDPLGPGSQGECGFYVSVDNGHVARLQATEFHNEFDLDLPAGYHIIGVGSNKYATLSATYTIQVIQN